MSLSDSIRNHVYENGRRYHSLNAGTYAIPNDEVTINNGSHQVSSLIWPYRTNKIGTNSPLVIRKAESKCQQLKPPKPDHAKAAGATMRNGSKSKH